MDTNLLSLNLNKANNKVNILHLSIFTSMGLR